MTQPTPPPQAVLSQMINGYWLTGAIHAAARLGVPDAVGAKAAPVAEIAARVGAHEESLFRLLRALCSVGIFIEGPARSFAHTPLSSALQKDVAGSMHGLALMTGLLHQRAWPEIAHTIRTGTPAFDKVFGKGIFAHVTDDAEAGAAFDAAMSGYVATSAAAIVQKYDFARFTRVVDVGGGTGALLAAILTKHPGLSGVNFDLPASAERSKAFIAKQGLVARCEVAAGDFFASVPSGADAYVLKAIIHDWDDDRCVAILRNVRKAIAPGGALLVIDAVLDAQSDAGAAAKLFDINMMVMTHGRERTADEHCALLERGGFRLSRVVDVNPTLSVIEAAPV